jgi:tRNA (Thr-GGU) A37 N-methylase
VSIEMNPIGFVRIDAEKVSRSWRASDVEGALVVDEAYTEGLGDIEPGQRIVVISTSTRAPLSSPTYYDRCRRIGVRAHRVSTVAWVSSASARPCDPTL